MLAHHKTPEVFRVPVTSNFILRARKETSLKAGRFFDAGPC
jgi:hypothetical protein